MEEGSRWLTVYMNALNILQDTGKPTIATVEGICTAGGHELVLSCDLIVAAESARLGQAEVLVGPTGAFALQLLLLIVGDKRVREIMLIGNFWKLRKQNVLAYQSGLADGTAEEVAADLVSEIIEQSSPQA